MLDTANSNRPERRSALVAHELSRLNIDIAALDGSFFNLRRLRAHTKTQERLIRDLLFAEDAALVAHTERARQRITSCFVDGSQLFGLEVSLKKTEVLHQPAPQVEYRPLRISGEGGILPEGKAGEEEEIEFDDCKDGNYKLRYKPKSVGSRDISVEVNGKPLTGSGQFDGPNSIAVSERTGYIAIADYGNHRVQLFDRELKYLRTIADKGRAAERIKYPKSVGFTASDEVIVIHGPAFKTSKMFLFTEHGDFIEVTMKVISQHLIDPPTVFVRGDGHMIVCDFGDNSARSFPLMVQD
ncbi:E3 ubiquitin-protein ligase TRIM71 [Stylophora pistillata]|uniref:E3 ubiquitin-protein ligase TRIM71 n=1 Tax=Stylophora pistillata TaxID=50429 RepID=A0A2B4RRU0_STYPI|nr:E3 ubiquitin-protein ligase TRIM71 [Stylophora pistillata]